MSSADARSGRAASPRCLTHRGWGRTDRSEGPMRLAVLALVLAAAAPRPGCGSGTAYAPCAGKACGDGCTACAPDDRDCVETAVVKACDPAGRCVPRTDGLCATAACAGKACATECTIDPPCRSATPPCMQPSQLGHCDPGGACVA